MTSGVVNGATRWVRLQDVLLENIGPFVGSHRVQLPTSGLTLIKGLVQETGDGSGAGKSTFLNALAYALGYSPFPATELQSWHTEDPMKVGLALSTAEGLVVVERGSAGLSVTKPGAKPVRGRHAEPLLAEILGMDAETRAMTTYRGQGEPPQFLSMTDAKKKEFLAALLNLQPYETVAANAAVKAKELLRELESAQYLETSYAEGYEIAKTKLADALAKVEGERPEALLQKVEALKLEAQALKAEAEVIEKRDQVVRDDILRDLKVELASIKQRRLEMSQGMPLELAAVQADLEKCSARVKKADAHDAEKHSEMLQEQGRLKARGTKLRAAADALLNWRQRCSDLEADIAKVQSGLCPTCGQDWMAEDHIEVLRRDLADAETHVARTAQAHAEMMEVAAALKALQLPEPHPIGVALRAKEKELASKIRFMRVTHDHELAQKLQNLDEEETALRCKAQLAVEASRAPALELYRRAEEALGTSAALREQAMATAAQEAVIKERRMGMETTAKLLQEAQERVATKRAAAALEQDVAALVGPQGFLGAIFDEVLADVAGHTNSLLAQVANVRHVTLAFETEKEASNGSVTKRIMPVLEVNGRRAPYRSGLSGGMRNAVGLAVDLAVGEVVAARRGTYPGWLVLDEAFDGLGRASKESCMDTLQAYAGDRLVLVVDHHTETQGLFQQVIKIESVDDRARFV